MKLIGGDSGRFEHEEFVSEVMLAPSERAVVDVLFDQPGPAGAGAPHPRPGLPARHDHSHRRARLPPLAEQFEELRTAPELAAEREFLATWLEAPPDKTLALIAEMDDIAAPGQGPVLYACPMHPGSPARSRAAARNAG